MRTRCNKKTMVKFFAVIGCIILLTMSSLITATPLDCPGVITVQGGYRLTRNTTCSFGWSEDNKFFSLMGFTLKADIIFVSGSDLTIRNGSVQANHMDWSFSNSGVLSNLIVTSFGSPRTHFTMAGNNFVVNKSLFRYIASDAIDFYFGEGGVVRNSIFFKNSRAIGITKSSNVLIERNRFISNAEGLSLVNSEGTKTSNNIIRYNVFRRNGVGINFTAITPFLPALEGSKILWNHITGSNYSGLQIKVYCRSIELPACSGQNTEIKGNLLKDNGIGFTGQDDISDDGISARATLGDGLRSNDPYPEGLAMVTLTNNRAYRNLGLGFDVNGVHDGGGHIAFHNGNPAQCDGLECRVGSFPHR